MSGKKPPKGKKPKPPGRPHCRGVTNEGKPNERPCKAKAAAGSMFCANHGGGKKRPGRESLLTPEFIDNLAKVVATGVTWAVAAQAVGIGESTIHHWRAQGADDIEADKDSPYRQLVEALTRAEAEAEQVLVEVIRAHSALDWRAAAFLLERRRPERWAKRAHLDIDVGERAKPRDVKPAGSTRETIIEILARATAAPEPSEN